MVKVSRGAEACKPAVRADALAKYGAAVVERFFQKVRVADGCWDWMGAKKSHADPQYGYGIACVGSKADNWRIMRAHRLSYELHTGPIPGGMIVCHRCDRPCCVNPAHLFVGTPADNTRDMHVKGRHWAPRGEASSAKMHPERIVRGASHFRAKLNEGKVRDIRSLAVDGISCCEIARRFGLSPQGISSVIARRTWKHVP